MSYYIRECNIGDIPKLVKLEKLCFPDPWTEEMFRTEFDNPLVTYYVAEIDEDSQDESKNTESYNGDKSDVSNPDSSTDMIAAKDGGIIGYIGFLTVAGECQINNVAVHPDYRKQEIASELLELVINETEDQGVTFWTLEVRVGNVAALKLYERFGFKQVGLRPYYYEDGAGAVLMTKELSNEIDRVENREGESELI